VELSNIIKLVEKLNQLLLLNIIYYLMKIDFKKHMLLLILALSLTISCTYFLINYFFKFIIMLIFIKALNTLKFND